MTPIEYQKEIAFLSMKVDKLEEKLNAVNIEYHDYKHKDRLEFFVNSKEELKIQISSLTSDNTKLRIKIKDLEREIQAFKIEKYQKRGAYV